MLINYILLAFNFSQFTVDFSLLWPCLLKFVEKFRTALLICQLHLSVSQPNCELCFEFCDLSVKKFVN